MTAASYTYEAILLVALAVITWILYIAQLLALRFTPRRKVVTIKVAMLMCGVFALIAASIRSSDASSVFGRINPSLSWEMGTQATAGIFYASISWMVASSRSLYLQVRQPMPKIAAPALFGAVAIFHISHTVINLVQSQMLARPEQYSEWAVMRLVLACYVILDVVVLFLLAVTLYFFVSLRSKISTFVTKLSAHAAARAIQRREVRQQQLELPFMDPVAYRAARAKMESERLAATTNVTMGSSLSPKAAASSKYNVQKPRSLQVRSGSSAASAAQEVELASSAAPVAGGATVAWLGPSNTPSGPGPMGTPTTQQARRLTATSELFLASPLASPTTAQQQSRRATPHSGQRVHFAPSTLPSTPSGAARSTTAAPAALNRSAASVAAAAAAVSAASAAASTQATQTRLSELGLAMRRLTRMTILGSILCVATIANTYSALLKGFNGEIVVSDVRGADPEEYTTDHLIAGCLHMLALFVIVWYTWLSPSVWMSSAIRRERNTPFWRTLRYGPQQHSEVLAKQPRSSQVAPSTTTTTTAGAVVATDRASAFSPPSQVLVIRHSSATEGDLTTPLEPQPQPSEGGAA